MPETRSKAGRSGTRSDSNDNDESSSQDQSNTTESTETSTDSSNTATTTDSAATTTTEGATATDESTSSQKKMKASRTEKQQTSTAKNEAPQPSAKNTENSETRKPDNRDGRSNHSKKSKSKTIQIAKAKEELIRLKIQLAAAQIATMEAEEATSDSDDDDTIIPHHEAQKRVGTWINENPTEVLAISDEPFHVTEPIPPTVQPIANTTSSTNTDSTQYIPVASALQQTNNRCEPVAATTHVPPIQRQLCAPTPAGAAAAAPTPAGAATTATTPAGAALEVATPIVQHTNLSELATALALAARIPSNTYELPQFYGAHLDWLMFKASYNETKSSFTENENLNRLRRCLKGKAKEAVRNLLNYNAKPEEIIKTLESRFGRPDSIALAEIENLRALPRPTDSPKDICIFASRFSNIVSSLRTLKKVHYLYNPEITKCTINKLTATMKFRWYDFAATQTEDEPDLMKLARFFNREAERCGPYAPPESVSMTKEDTSPSTRRAYKSFATTEQNKTSRPCPICDRTGHKIEDCEKFLTADTDARWNFAKNKYLCFRCLRYKNKTHSCRRNRCEINGCQQWHNRLLHFVRKSTPEKESNEVVTSTWTPTNTRCFLKIVPVRVAGPKREVQTYALLDDGSTVTLIDSELAQQIGARGRNEPLHIEAIGNTEVEAATSRRVNLKLHGATQSYNIYARTIDNLQLSPQQITDEDIRGCKHLEDIQNSLVYDHGRPKILIGQDNWELLIATEVRRGHRNQPAASRTPIGWVLHGAQTRTLGKYVHYVHNITATTEENMDEQLRRHFAIESLTITPKRPSNDPEIRALTTLQECTIQTEDGHYQTALLWKQDNIKMPNNYENALKRLRTTEKRIGRDPILRLKYEEQMNALIEKGYAERAPPQNNKDRTWYLPHFPVLNPMKPDKVRIVHDAAAKTKNVSLNDHLLTGPDLLQSLPGVIMRFRQHPVAISADIAEMFMQVKIRPEDRDALRYLWRDNREGDHPPCEYRMTSLIFGATSSPATAIFVKNLNAEKYKETEPEAYTAIVKSHYVDDYIQSFENEEKAIEISRKVRDIHKEAHFTLKQWVSNSKKVLDAIDNNSQRSESVELRDETKVERILGIIWKPEEDKLAFNLNLARLPPAVMSNENPTKREVLKIIMSLYDPLGFAAPITTRAKQIFQEIWRRGTEWDKPIEADLEQQWMEWKNQLYRLRDVTIPRCYLKYTEAVSLQLHTFVDASEAAYAAVLYWRIVTPDGKTTISLVLAKARVAPIKTTSIPRLELQAAVMGSRMAQTVIEEHDKKPEAKFFWTDSKTVLTWLKNGARSYRPFVAHRIAAIEENSSLNEWQWISTKHNVADDATRDVPRDLSRWYDGPSFLRNEQKDWPTERPALHEPTGEERACTINTKKVIPKLIECVPPPDRFSKWEKLLRTTARVLQFIRLCKRKSEKTYYGRTKKNPENDPTWKRNKKAERPTASRLMYRKIQEIDVRPIDVDLIQKAEIILLKVSQEQAFHQELNDLRNNRAISTKSRLHHLSVELKNDVIHLKTRIGAAQEISETQKSPPILDGDNHIARLYIEYVHRQLLHSGVENTINECRLKYWILRIRTVTRMIIHRCLICRIKKATPPQPSTGNHPLGRVAHHRRPFSFVGLDYFGPITVKVGRTRQKRYVALFTCLTTRAIHLEIAASLDKNSAIMALRRMIARRGCPTEIWSDNGTNLRGADRELRQSIEKSTMEEANKKMIRWRFIPPAAPFMGGAWERLVRSVKNSLNIVLGNHEPTEEVLTTVLAEVEYTVNSRSLTHVSVDPDSLESLTPNHFLMGTDSRIPIPGTFDENDMIGRAHWRASQHLADTFWNRWVREYLPELQNRREPHGKGTSLQMGDVVLIVDNTLPRNTWPKGVVTQVYPGADGVVRTADIQTKGGLLRRPTKKLVILSTEPTVALQQ